ncbi:MAG: FHA domain-containing protein [Gammaproteobacteria bacterium]
MPETSWVSFYRDRSDVELDILIPVALLLFMLGVGAGVLLFRNGDKSGRKGSEAAPNDSAGAGEAIPAVEPTASGDALRKPVSPVRSLPGAEADPLAITPKVPMPSAFLEDLSGATPEAKLSLPGARTFIGRSRITGEPGSHCVVVPRPSVGRRHACLYFREGRFFIADLHSRNGTFVNGSPVHEDVPINTGDEIAFHHYRFRFVVEGRVTGAAVRPEVDDDVTEVPLAVAAHAHQPSAKPPEVRPAMEAGESTESAPRSDQVSEESDIDVDLGIPDAESERDPVAGNEGTVVDPVVPAAKGVVEPEDVGDGVVVDPVVPDEGTVVDPVIPTAKRAAEPDDVGDGTVVDPVVPDEGTVVDPVIPTAKRAAEPDDVGDGTVVDPVVPDEGTVVDPVIPTAKRVAEPDDVGDGTVVDPVVPGHRSTDLGEGDQTIINRSAGGVAEPPVEEDGTILDRGQLSERTIVDPVRPHEEEVTRGEAPKERRGGDRRGDEPTRILPRGKE